MNFRSLHRWFGLVSSVLFIGISLTALGLQIDLWVTGTPPPGQADKSIPAPDPLPSDDVIVNAVQTALVTARQENPDMAASAITITLRGPAPRVVIGNARQNEEVLTVNGATGAVIPPPPAKIDWHYVLQDIHAGYFLGTFGRIVSVLLAFSLLLISITGLQVYLDMYSRRRKLGRKGMFWK